MFKKIDIIGIDRKNIVFAKIKPKGNGKIIHSSVFKYDFVTIRDILLQAIQKFKFKKVRILFSDDLSYILQLNIPKELEGVEEKNYIYGKIVEQIPENLADSEWDFKELEKISIKKFHQDDPQDNSQKSVLVFAPVKNLYKRVSEVLENADITIEAVEAEMMAKNRNPNPLIGIAQKTDLIGRDEYVLNIGSNLDDKTEEEKQTEKRKIKSPKFLFILFLIIITILITFVTIFFRTTIFDKIASYKSETTTIENNSKSEVSEDKNASQPENVPEDNIEDIGKFKLVVLNGSGISGSAAKAKETLTYEGFSDIEVGNATKSGEITFVKMKKEIPNSIYEVIERALNGDYKIELGSDKLDSGGVFDIEIVLGMPIIE